MKLTFISEQDGLKVEMNFEAEFIYDIEEMFKQFLKGTGFTVADEDMYTKQENVDTSEECVHESDKELQRPVKSFSGGVPWSATPINCSQHPDAPHGYDRDRSLNEHRDACACESWWPPMSEKCVQKTDATEDWEAVAASQALTIAMLREEIKELNG